MRWVVWTCWRIFSEVLVPDAVWQEVQRHRPSARAQAAVTLWRVSPLAPEPPALEALAQVLSLHTREWQALRVAWNIRRQQRTKLEIQDAIGGASPRVASRRLISASLSSARKVSKSVASSRTSLISLCSCFSVYSSILRHAEA